MNSRLKEYLGAIFDMILLLSWPPLINYGMENHHPWAVVVGVVELIAILVICFRHAWSVRHQESDRP